MHRVTASWLGSLAIHAGALASAYLLASLVPELKFQRGRTVVQLQASIAAAPRETSDDPPTRVTAEQPKSAKPPPAVRPEVTEVARRRPEMAAIKSPAPTPPPIEPPPKVEPVAAREPDSARPIDEMAVAPPPKRRAAERKPATIDAPIVSAAQMATAGSQGSEYDELPRPLPQNMRPAYPPDAYARRQVGSVVLRLTISAEGRVDDVRVATSSGVESLDDSAIRTARTWRFQPARRGGSAVGIVLDMQVNFSFNT